MQGRTRHTSHASILATPAPLPPSLLDSLLPSSVAPSFPARAPLPRLTRILLRCRPRPDCGYHTVGGNQRLSLVPFGYAKVS